MMDELLGLNGKSAVVLGAGQGMGESVAILLARAGCGVAAVDIDAGRAAGIARIVGEHGGRAHPICADALDDAQLVAAIEEADAHFGGIDVLIAIIGDASWGSLLELTADEWDLDQRRNTRYFFLAARTAAAAMIRRGRGGSIACLSSVAGMQSSPRHAAYGAAKAGLVNLVRTMAVEWAPHGIRVNAVGPGTITTPRTPETVQRVAAIRGSVVPMKRIGTAQEVATALLFLVSDMASYVTGHTLPVDGGWMSAFLFEGRPGGTPARGS